MCKFLTHRTSWKIVAVVALCLTYIYRAGFMFPSTSDSLLPSQTSLTPSMSTQKVLYILEPKGDFAVKERDIQEPGPGEVLIEIHATALNPVDWKIKVSGIFVAEYPAVVGTDAAGIIKKVGTGVTSFAVGDRVYVPCLYARLQDADGPQARPGLLRQPSRHVPAVLRRPGRYCCQGVSLGSSLSTCINQN